MVSKCIKCINVVYSRKQMETPEKYLNTSESDKLHLHVYDLIILNKTQILHI